MPNILLAFLGVILLLRLIIGLFFQSTDAFFRDDFSSLSIAFFIFVLGVIWLATKLLKAQALKKSGLELPIILFFAAAAASLFYAPDFSSSLNGVLVLGAQITFFYMLLDLLDTTSRLRASLIFLLILTYIVAGYGIITFFVFWLRPAMPEDINLLQTNTSLYFLLIHHRAVSFLGWPNVLAGFLLLFLPLTIVFPFQIKKTSLKAAAFTGLFLTAVCFLYTLSFLGWLSFLFSTIVLLPLFWKKLNIDTWPKKNKRMLLYGFLAFLVLFILVMLRKDFTISLKPRIFYYKAAFLLLAKNPLWGYGWDSFGILCRTLTNDRNNLSLYIHNSYLQIWLETGIVGLLAVVFLVKGVFSQSWKMIKSLDGTQPKQIAGIYNDWLLIAIVWGLLAFFIDNLFSFTMLLPNVAIYWWTILAVFCAMIRTNQIDASPTGRAGLASISNTIIKGTSFILIVFIFVIMARIISGYVLYYKAMNTKKPGGYTSALEMIDQAQKIDPWGSYLPVGAGNIHLAEYGVTRIKKFLKLSSFDFNEAIRRSPKVYYNYFVISKIYEALGDTALFKINTQKAKELSPSQYVLDDEMFHKSDNK